MKRNLLTEKQKQILVILHDGKILHFYATGELSLLDNEGNEHPIRRDAFEKLKRIDFIIPVGCPSIDVYEYETTSDGINYAIKFIP